MPTQLELSLFKRPAIELKPAKARAPRLWVRRLVLWRDPDVVIRDIPLRKGLNIIWSPDPSDARGARGETAALGHGAGKTLFCRLLRYCLGEDRFAPEGQRDDIGVALPEGVVGIELLLDDELWSVARPLGHRRRHVAGKGIDLETLMREDSSSISVVELVAMLDEQIVTQPIAALVPGTDSAWLTALAWLTRDQECRFGHPLDWRAFASGSESPVRGYARADSLLAVRALIGAFTRDEQILRETMSSVEQQTASASKEVEHRTWQAGQLRRNLLLALDRPEETVAPGRLGIDALRREAAGRTNTSLPANDVEDERALPVVRANFEQATSELSRIDTELASTTAATEARRKMLAMIRGELPSASVAIDEGNNPVCPICEVPIDHVLATGCKLSRELPDLDALKARHARLMSAAQTAQADIDDGVSRERTLKQQRTVVAGTHAQLKTRLAGLELVRDARLDERRTAFRLVDDVERLDAAILDLESAIERARELEAKLKDLRDQSAQMRGETSENLRRLDAHFGAMVQRLASASAEGNVRITGNGLQLGITMGGNCSTAAIDSLKVIAFDLATMCLSIEGASHLPAFLVHDSPREADLGESSYHQLFHVVKALESIAEEPPFQYIVTTTTRPPDELVVDPWLRLEIHGGPASERLLGCDLSGDQTPLSDEQAGST